MGSAHAIHILLAINIRVIGAALRASSKLSQKVASSAAASTSRFARRGSPRSRPWTIQALKDWISRRRPSPEFGQRTIRIMLVKFGPLPVEVMETFLGQLRNELKLRRVWASVDLVYGWDLTDRQVMALLLEMYRAGAINGVTAMPPQCRGAVDAQLWTHCLAIREGVEMRGGRSALSAASHTLIKLDPEVHTKLGAWTTERVLARVEASLCRFAIRATEEFYLTGNLPRLEPRKLMCDHPARFPDQCRPRSMPGRLARSRLALVCAEAQAMLLRGHGPGGRMKGSHQSRRPPTCPWPAAQHQIGYISLNDASAKGPILRRKAALRAAARLECHLPWTDTHHQPANFLSRIH